MQHLSEFIFTNFWAIAGGGLGLCIAAFFTWRNNRINRLATACTAFRASFIDELAALESRGGMAVSTRDLLLSVHLKHSAAVAEFKGYLFWRRRSFDRYWQQHHHGHSFDAKAFEIPAQDHLYLIYLAITEAEEGASRVLAAKNIRALFRFAKET